MTDRDLDSLKRPYAPLSWGEGGPISDLSGDVYFSAEDGLEEARAVFLSGAGFPDRFNDDLTVVGELGFGTGLNFLALTELFLAHAKASSRLHFVSVEGWPLNREDAAKALSAFPELKELAADLLAAWPSSHKGAHRRVFANGRVTLTVFHDDSEAALENMEFKADAWFLDGFSPAKNPDMWTDTLFNQIARLSKTGAPAATFTVAGVVRRGLAAAGFAVEKRPGFGRKRERLEAVYEGGLELPIRPGFASQPPTTGNIAIIGGGIAAAALADALKRRGRQFTVFADGGWAQGASSAPLGLLTPRLEAADRPQNRALLAAYDYAANLYRSRGWLKGEGILRCAVDDKGCARLKALSEQLDDRFVWLTCEQATERLGAPVQAGLWVSGAGRFNPVDVVAGLAEGIDPVDVEIRQVTQLEQRWELVDANGLGHGPFDAVVVAGGYAANGLGPLELEATAGQVARFETGLAPDVPVAWGGYVSPTHPGEILVGATHVKGDDAGDLASGEAASRSVAANAPVKLDPGQCLEVWSGVRAAVADRLPLCGPSPGPEFANLWRATARNGALPDGSSLGIDGPILLSAFGARGFAHAPLLAEELASALCGEPAALQRDSIDVLHPARFLWRSLRRGG